MAERTHRPRRTGGRKRRRRVVSSPLARGWCTGCTAFALLTGQHTAALILGAVAVITWTIG